MKKNVLLVKNISKEFSIGQKKISVLKNIVFTCMQGSSYALMGVSGTGKSTLMHIIAGLENPTTGTVLFNDQDIFQYTTQEKTLFLNKSIGLLFQNPYLIREFSVIENIMLPGYIAGMSVDTCVKRAEELLVHIKLSEKKDTVPSSLSGGQQQRVALARALFNKPSFLLADEPTGNLDIQTGKAMVDLLLAGQEEWGMGLIISTHDMYVAQAMGHVYQLKDGRIYV